MSECFDDGIDIAVSVVNGLVPLKAIIGFHQLHTFPPLYIYAGLIPPRATLGRGIQHRLPAPPPPLIIDSFLIWPFIWGSLSR